MLPFYSPPLTIGFLRKNRPRGDVCLTAPVIRFDLAFSSPMKSKARLSRYFYMSANSGTLSQTTGAISGC